MTTPTRSRTRTIDGRRLVPAGYALVTGLIALVVATLLNAASLLETAQRQPLGSTTRSFAVGVMEPIAGFSELIRLDLPRELIDRALGKGDYFGSDAGDGPVVIAPTDDTTASTTTVAPSGGTATTAPPAATTSTAPAPIVDDELAIPTEADPMFLWIIGDSFMEMFGPALRNDAFETGVVESEVDFRFISGLVRADYFDWPAHVRKRMPEVEADAVVVMFGGNDGQSMVWEGVELQPDTPEWLEVYGRLVGNMMDLLLEGGAQRIYWIGLPIMRSEAFTDRIIGFNGVYRAEADERPEVTYISSFELFQDENGEYSTYLRDRSGDLQTVRSPDGAHFLWPGAYRLADHVLPIIAGDWGFSDRLE